MSEPDLLPLFLKLSGRKVLVVGAGKVALGKVWALEGTGAELVVVAPDGSEELAARPLTWHRRPFAPADLDDAWLVISAATPEVNREVSALCEARRLFVVAVDEPALCSAFGGGIVRRGGVTFAVGTQGAAPALAGLLREGLEALLPPDLDAWLEQARTLRPTWKASALPMAARRPALLRALNALYPEQTS